MNAKHLFQGTVAGALIFLAGEVSAAVHRTEINPALLYWKAFSILPSTDKGVPIRLGYGFIEETPTPQEVQFAKSADGAFRLFRRAVRMQVPCDWGSDPADGPESIQPNLIKVRQSMQLAVLRIRVALDGNRPEAARDDLLCALVLARHSATDGALVNVMVQVACEDMLASCVAGNYGRFSAPLLREIAVGFAGEPRHVPVKSAIAVERALYSDWLVDALEQIQSKYPANDARALADCESLMREFTDSSDEILSSAGATVAGTLQYVKQIAPLYDELAKVGVATPATIASQGQAFAALIAAHPNQLAHILFPNVVKARTKEIEVEARLAMVTAAAALKSGGEAEFRKVRDPFGDGPFLRESMEGRHGFELRSHATELGVKATLFFAE